MADVSRARPRVGDDVRAVTLHADDGRTIEATVTDGHYVAWWPEAALTLFRPLSSQGSMQVAVIYDLTLADGTLVHDAQPVRPT